MDVFLMVRRKKTTIFLDAKETTTVVRSSSFLVKFQSSYCKRNQIEFILVFESKQKGWSLVSDQSLLNWQKLMSEKGFDYNRFATLEISGNLALEFRLGTFWSFLPPNSCMNLIGISATAKNNHDHDHQMELKKMIEGITKKSPADQQLYNKEDAGGNLFLKIFKIHLCTTKSLL